MTLEGPEGPRGDVLIAKPFARLGRDKRSEIELADATVLPCHLYLHATGDGIYCVGFAPGLPSGWLLPSATLEIGPFRVRASLADVAPPSAAHDPASDPQAKGSAGPRVPNIRMFIDKSRSSHADFLLQRQLTLIGRQAPSTWRIKHPTISRTHGTLVWDGADLWLIDFFSSNGTRLGDNRCDAGLVRVGQEFRVGTVTCCYLDVQPARPATSLVGEQAAAEVDSADNRSTQRPPDAGRGHAGEAVRERRVDGPQPRDEIVAPHATDSVRAGSPSPADMGAAPPNDGPATEAAPAALVETRPLTGDTKFVDRPQRSVEDRLAAAEVELAAQRDVAAARATRIDAELLSLRQEVERLAAALRQEREADRDHRAQVAELRERVLRELAQIGEQTQLVRQACDARSWEGSMAKLAEDIAVRCSELERQVREGLQSAADKLAVVEGTMIARMAELRSLQHSLGKRPAVAIDDPENVLSAEPIAEEWPAGEDAHHPQTPEGGTLASGANVIDLLSTDIAGESKRPSGESVRRAASRSAVAEGSPQWTLGEEFTHRLLDFQAKRERSAWQRRLLWTAVAVVSAAVIIAAAGLSRLWFKDDQAPRSGAAPAQQAEQSKPVEEEAE